MAFGWVVAHCKELLLELKMPSHSIHPSEWDQITPDGVRYGTSYGANKERPCKARIVLKYMHGKS